MSEPLQYSVSYNDKFNVHVCTLYYHGAPVLQTLVKVLIR